MSYSNAPHCSNSFAGGGGLDRPRRGRLRALRSQQRRSFRSGPLSCGLRNNPRRRVDALVSAANIYSILSVLYTHTPPPGKLRVLDNGPQRPKGLPAMVELGWRAKDAMPCHRVSLPLAKLATTRSVCVTVLMHRRTGGRRSQTVEAVADRREREVGIGGRQENYIVGQRDGVFSPSPRVRRMLGPFANPSLFARDCKAAWRGPGCNIQAADFWGD